MSWSVLSPFIQAGISQVASSALAFCLDAYVFQMIFNSHPF